jgi:thymidylate kinase
MHLCRGFYLFVATKFRLPPGFKFDVCVVLDLPVEEAFENVKRRDGELCRIEGLDRQVFEKARWAYMNKDTVLQYANHYVPIYMHDVIQNDLSSSVARDLAEFLIRDYENERPNANSHAG